jgi:hypothetical protein
MKINNGVQEAKKSNTLKYAAFAIAFTVVAGVSFQLGVHSERSKTPAMRQSGAKTAAQLTAEEWAQVTALNAELETIQETMRHKIQVYFNTYHLANTASRTAIHDSFLQAGTDMQDARTSGCTILDRKQSDKDAYEGYIAEIEGFTTQLEGIEVIDPDTDGFLSNRVADQLRWSSRSLNDRFWNMYKKVAGSHEIDVLKYQYTGYMTGAMSTFSTYSADHISLSQKLAEIMSYQANIIIELNEYVKLGVYTNVDLTADEQTLQSDINTFFVDTLGPALIAFNSVLESDFSTELSSADSSSQTSIQNNKDASEVVLDNAYDNVSGLANPQYESAVGVAYGAYVGLVRGYVEGMQAAAGN